MRRISPNKLLRSDMRGTRRQGTILPLPLREGARGRGRLDSLFDSDHHELKIAEYIAVGDPQHADTLPIHPCVTDFIVRCVGV